MSVRIRLRRVGRKKQPMYRIVVTQSSAPRGGVYIDNVGFYNPRHDPIELKIDLERIDQWIAKGAELTPTVASLVRKVRRGEAVAAPASMAGAEAAKAEAASVAATPEPAVEAPAPEEPAEE